MMNARISVAAVLCAAGSSSRMQGEKKQFRSLGRGSTVLGTALSAFARCPRIDCIVVAVPPETEAQAAACLPPELRADGRVCFVAGGRTRRASVHNALLHLQSWNPSHVLIHDGARPWIKPELIEKVIDAAIAFGAVIPAVPLLETPKELELGQPPFIKRHLKRAALCAAQTPQGFSFPEILAAHEKAAEREKMEGMEYTDDAEVWGEVAEQFAGQVVVIPGDIENRKITFAKDLEETR